MDPSDYGPLLTAEAFLDIDFGERIKAELDDRTIVPLVRGPIDRVWVSGNLLVLVAQALRGTDLRAYGALLMVKTAPRSVRFPDVAVYAKEQRPVATEGDRDLMQNPILAIHVRPMDASAAGRLLSEYQAQESIQAVMFVDQRLERVRLVQRTATGAWLDERFGFGGEVAIPHSASACPTPKSSTPTDALPHTALHGPTGVTHAAFACPWPIPMTLACPSTASCSAMGRCCP